MWKWNDCEITDLWTLKLTPTLPELKTVYREFAYCFELTSTTCYPEFYAILNKVIRWGLKQCFSFLLLEVRMCWCAAATNSLASRMEPVWFTWIDFQVDIFVSTRRAANLGKDTCIISYAMTLSQTCTVVISTCAMLMYILPFPQQKQQLWHLTVAKVYSGISGIS